MIRASVIVAALSLSACVIDESHPARSCASDAECAGGQTCDRGFCVGAGDAGVCTVTDTPCDDTGFSGMCMEGRIVECEGGSTECRPLVAPLTETCNERDDDCDGMSDEGIRLDTVSDCGACGASCGTGLACCDGACVDTDSNDTYCGGCGAEQACDTAGGERCCGATCRDLREDPANCGVCGRECATGESCCQGECVQLDSDPDACGTCGNACGDGERCCRGECALPTSTRCESCAEDCSASGLDCCNGSCVDTDTNRTHCGACGVSCGAGEFCCEGRCITSTDENCGACGTSCGESELCCADRCVANNSPNCGACGTICPPGTACCGNGCFDLQADAAHCGTCETACTGTDACSNGRCCPAGRTNCGGACVDLQTDRNNCGTCGTSCLLGCSDGSCSVL